MIASCLAMSAVVKESSTERIIARRKVQMCLLNITSFLIAIYFYVRHNSFCEPGGEFNTTFLSLRHFGHFLRDISVICLTVVWKLTVTVFISLYFQRFWPKWLSFFSVIQKHSGLWPKKNRFNIEINAALCSLLYGYQLCRHETVSLESCCLSKNHPSVIAVHQNFL